MVGQIPSVAWDTSSKSAALAALEWDASGNKRLVAEWQLGVDATHSENLLWALDRLLESARWKLADVDVLGVGVGPGSFTGLRIGMTTARMLAECTGKKLIGFSSLAALARPAADHLVGAGLGGVHVISAVDACKGELYVLSGLARGVAGCVAMADGDHAGVWQRGVHEEVMSIETAAQVLGRKLNAESAKWCAVGDGRERYPEVWKALGLKREVPSGLGAAFPHQIQGRYAALLAWEAHQAALGRDPMDVHPRYLRASDAELNLRRKVATVRSSHA